MRCRSGVAVLSIAALSGVIFVAAQPARSKGQAPAPKPAAKPTYAGHVAPLVQKYCANCHGDKAEIGGINVQSFKDEASVIKGRKVWEKIVQNIQAGHMPPKNAPQPTAAERTLMTSWINAKLAAVDCDIKDPGRVTMRRLNRTEYNNTVRDLLGVQVRPADDFPSDDVGYGFDNIGDVLSISPILMEKYLAAAEKVAEAAIVTPDPEARRFEAERIPETGGQGVVSGGNRTVNGTGEVWVDYEFPLKGAYVLRTRAWGERANAPALKVALRVDGKDVQALEIPAGAEAAKDYEARVTVEAGKHRFAVVLPENEPESEPKADAAKPADPKDEEARKEEARRRQRNRERLQNRALAVDYLEIVGPMGGAQRELPDSHKRLFSCCPPTKETRRECARKILTPFARRAYRRAVTVEEVNRLIRYVDLAEKEGESFERGIQLAVQAALVSPNFLFMVEGDRGKPGVTTPKPINNYELATRLSYFLWSSMPDEELLKVAEKGKLTDPAVLEHQTRRMLKDPKATALVANFASQWLQLRNLRSFNPDPERFPQWSEALRADMLKETELFFETVMREDRSVLEFLDTDWTVLNERLAKHYGIDGVSGEQFRRVALKTNTRGGIITQGSILAVTSNPTRTSPVKRGRWVLEQLLGTPPPPPPPDVPELKEGKDVMLTGTLRQRMEQHRTDPGCASCHSRMDPIGFGMENFDAIGSWRTKEGEFPVDASGTLPSGESFDGPGGLKQILMKQKGQFVRTLTENLLTYGLGRGLESYDRCSVDEMSGRIAKRNYRFSELVMEVVKSEPFRMRKGEEKE